MKQCSIDAEYRGEERYSKLSLAYEGAEEKKKIDDAIQECTAMCTSLTPQVYTSESSNGRKLIVIEYHDDYDRDAGKVFEAIMKQLDIKVCQ